MRPTTVASLTAGQVEFRLDRRGDAVVLIFHGGHVRAGLPMGEEVFAAAGYTVLVPSRPGYGRTALIRSGFCDPVRGGPTAATMAVRASSTTCAPTRTSPPASPNPSW